MNKAIALVLAFVSTVAFAAPPGTVGTKPIYPKSSFSTDQSDLWWNPNESGWGMQLVQQGSFIFATLYIYGANGQPTWVTAQLSAVGTLTWSGPLYVTDGPWFGGPFDPSSVGIRQAGTMTFSAPFVDSGTVTYSIDGVTVTKQVEREFLTYDNYNGTFVSAVHITASACFDSSEDGTNNGAMTIGINQSETAMSMEWVFPAGQACTYSGSYSQAGRMGEFTGTYTCSTGEVGQMTFFEMTNRIGMISGRLQGQSSSNGCQYTGSFTGLDPNQS